jgi:hypothetical protein
MSENMITLSLNPTRLTGAGQRALATLLKECMSAAEKSGIVPKEKDPQEVARSFYRYVAKHSSQKGVVDKLLDDVVATYKEAKKAAGHPNGGAPMAGTMSSLTRNWQRSCGVRNSRGVIKWDDYKERYYFEPEFLVELRKARDFFNEEHGPAAR